MSSFENQKKKKEIIECNKILQELSRSKDNSRCCDCGGYPAKWCSVNIGCFLCLRCSGIHRGLGTHISFVKSITLDDWNYSLLNKFKLLGGNKKVNQIYEQTLKINKKKDKINYKQFIHSKYVEKKWIKKQKNKNKVEKKHKRQKRRKSEQKKVIKKHKPQPRFQQGEQQHFSINDNPSNWIKFTENEHKTDIVLFNDDKPERNNKCDKNDMIPDLLDFNSMQNFAFSDLASFNNHDEEQKESNKSQTIEINEVDDNSKKLNKAAILSKYNNTPSNWIRFQSPSPRDVKISKNDLNVYQSYNPYHGFNQFNFIRPVINYNMNNMNDRQQRHQSVDNTFVVNNPFDIDIFEPQINNQPEMKKKISINNIDINIDNDKKEEVIYLMSPINHNNNNNNNNNNDNNKKNKNMLPPKFDPFDHIANLCNNNNGYYVYNSNVSC